MAYADIHCTIKTDESGKSWAYGKDGELIGEVLSIAPRDQPAHIKVGLPPMLADGMRNEAYWGSQDNAPDTFRIEYTPDNSAPFRAHFDGDIDIKPPLSINQMPAMMGSYYVLTFEVDAYAVNWTDEQLAVVANPVVDNFCDTYGIKPSRCYIHFEQYDSRTNKSVIAAHIHFDTNIQLV